jgi:chromosome segregation ATPase
VPVCQNAATYGLRGMRIFSRQSEPPDGWFQIGEVPEQASRRRGSGRVSLNLVQGEQNAERERPGRRGGSVLLARANVPASAVRREQAQAAELSVELRSARHQLQASQGQLRSSQQRLEWSQRDLRSSRRELQSSRSQVRSLRQELQSSQTQARSSRQALAQAQRTVVARSQAAENGRTHASRRR